VVVVDAVQRRRAQLLAQVVVERHRLVMARVAVLGVRSHVDLVVLSEQI
jgi:hypothetical protein